MKIGFGTQLWLMDDHFENFPRMLDELALVGFDGFEMCFPFLIDQYERKVGELRQLLGMHDLELSCYYTGIAFHEPDQLEQGVAEFKRRCRFSAELGTQYALLDGGQKQEGATAAQLDDHIKLIAETANELGSYARSCGLTMSWHQHWGSIFEVQAPLHRLMELSDPDLVRFCPDLGQLALGDFDVLETIERYVDRIDTIHFKDVTFDGRPRGELWPGGPTAPSDDGAYTIDSRGRWVELGRGVVDFHSVTRVLRAAGYDGWITDDFDFSCYPARSSAQACKDYLNQALGRWGERDIRRGVAPETNQS